jgi:tetratricopeptide (TPR) repeat protein
LIRNREQRRQAFRQVVATLDQYLAISQSVQSAGWAHYWMGRFYFELLEHDTAVVHLQIALTSQFKPLEARCMLGEVYVRIKAYDQADKMFREAAVEALKHYNRLGRTHPPRSANRYDTKLGEEKPIHIWLAWAHLYSALALAERGVNLGQAVRRASHALRHIMRIANQEDYAEYMAIYFECMGWIYFRTAQLSEDIADANKTLCLNRAVLDLEHSVSLQAGSDVWANAYYRLAQVYSAQVIHEPARRDHWQTKAVQAALHCQEADLRGEFTAEIDKLLQPQKPDAQPDVVVQVNRTDIASGSQSK